MAKTIVQRIVFKNTNTTQLYELYMNAALHSKVTEGRATITKKENTYFSAYDDYISGKNLQLIPDQLIVQSWRASDWSADDIDSTFIIYLEQKGKSVLLRMVHANVPDEHAESLHKGWHEHYWNLWKVYLSEHPSK